MCDFKPGDEVVAVKTSGLGLPAGPIPVGFVGHVASVHWSEFHGQWGIQLVEMRVASKNGTAAACFRKVQRRDLTAWLSTATDFEEPKRKREPKKEGV